MIASFLAIFERPKAGTVRCDGARLADLVALFERWLARGGTGRRAPGDAHGENRPCPEASGLQAGQLAGQAAQIPSRLSIEPLNQRSGPATLYATHTKPFETD